MAASVLVLGGGFAGLRAVRELARGGRLLRGRRHVAVRLIDRQADSEFSPLYPDLISGRMGPGVLRYPLAPACRRLGAEFVQAEVRRIDAAGPAVETDHGRYEADFIICCLGCETNFFGDRQARAQALGLKTVSEGLAIRAAAERLLAEAAAGGERPSFIVVGGGYTGFESASHLAHLVSRRTGLPFERLGEAAEIVIVERNDECLRNVSPQVRQWAAQLMAGFGVTVRTGVTVERFEDADQAAEGAGSRGPQRVTLTDGTRRERAAVVWAAGVTPGDAVAAWDAPKAAGRRLKVDEQLRVGGLERIFAAGDVGGATRRGEDHPLRMGVQFSLMAGRCAARNVLATLSGRRLEAFYPMDPGYIVPLAPGAGAGVIMGHELHGVSPQLLHYLMCSARSWGWANRLGVLASAFRRRG